MYTRRKSKARKNKTQKKLREKKKMNNGIFDAAKIHPASLNFKKNI
jgi:hypothetical protein